MSDQNIQTIVANYSWFQPNAMSLLLGNYSHDDMIGFRNRRAEVLYKAFPIVPDKDASSHLKGNGNHYNWQLNAQFQLSQTPAQRMAMPQDSYPLPVSPARKGILTNMNDAQKDHVLRVIEADHLRMVLYEVSGKEKQLLQRYKERIEDHGYRDGKSILRIMAPKIMTTKAAFFPLDQVPASDRKPTICDLYRENYFDVQTVLHQPEKVPENVWKNMYPYVKDDFRPTQFVAFHHYGVRDKGGQVNISDQIATQFKNEPRKIFEKNFGLSQDVWLIFAAEPYNLRYATCVTDMKSARELLRALEHDFINKYYQQDSRLCHIDDMLSGIAGSDPAHYSHFTDAIISRYENAGTENVPSAYRPSFN